MELQQKRYSCGPAALRAALYVLGKSVLEKTIRKIAGTTPEGTDEVGLKNTISHYKFRHKEFLTSSVREASDFIKGEVRKGRPILICTEKWGHWTTVVGMLGNKLIVFDPAGTGDKRRKKYSGLRLYTVSALLEKWGYLNSTGYVDGQDIFHDPDDLTYYYGITVLPPKD